ncbi:MAG TPA: alpha/beta fold hydrolase [Mycobacteriales bacterium]|jgi:pimeloyl-ACP methyl ester carboxylesterase|nr:alpha/beta fold hydrolase [Mycobacteriales bacterium]
MQRGGLGYARGAVRTLAAIPNLDALFAARLREGVKSALADEYGSVVFDAPPVGAWTVRLDHGRVRLARGRARRPRATITADPSTLASVLEGRISGVEAYLDHGLTVRGDLALALQMDSAFDVGERPAAHPVVKAATVFGARTSYLEAGPADAPPVVLLHGLGATNASMLPLVPALAKDHRVIAPDFPGFGASAAPRWRYRPGDLAAWLQAFSSHIGVRKPVLIGNSMGGRVAIEAALTAPDTVERLVLLCPSPAFRRFRELAPAVRLLPPGALLAPTVIPHWVLVRVVRSFFADPDRLPDTWYQSAADEFLRVMRGYRHRRAFYAALREIYLDPAYGEEGFWERLPGLGVPSLFIWGDRDWLVPVAFEQHVVRALPQADSVVLNDCGHVPQFEHPTETNALIHNFLTAPERLY